MNNKVFLKGSKNSYVVSIEYVHSLRNKGVVPDFVIGNDFNVFDGAPVIAVPLQKKFNSPDYVVKKSNITFLKSLGLNIRLMDPLNIDDYMDDVDGLVLPGGRISYPKDYSESIEKPSDYIINKIQNSPWEINQSLYGYVKSFLNAKEMGIPVLGICAGAQISSSMYDFQIYNVEEKSLSKINHREPKEEIAHNISIVSNTPLFNMFNRELVKVNSIHRRVVDERGFKDSKFQIYAKCVEEDGQKSTVEAFGNEDDKILCVQWHPEVMFSKYGNKEQLVIGKWLRDKAIDFKKHKKTTAVINNYTEYQR